MVRMSISERASLEAKAIRARSKTLSDAVRAAIADWNPKAPDEPEYAHEIKVIYDDE